MTDLPLASSRRRAASRRGPIVLTASLCAFLALAACGRGGASRETSSAPAAHASRIVASSMAETASDDLGSQAHLDRVMTSAFCASCHPVIYAEHRENTHGRAFVDEEARLATRGMRRADCIRCHTPRPIFETGIGMTPIRRLHDLEEGNTCMTCHWKAGYDYSGFVGGPECDVAFDPRAGSVQACVTCHRVAATPEQWSRAVNGKEKGRTCMTCHMPQVLRPVAVGSPPRMVHSHLFPAADNETQIRKAYTYATHRDGNVFVVDITNSGAGHNFNTGTAQRALQSLVIVRDPEGKELYRSRMTFGNRVLSPELLSGKDLSMPKNFQIPSGATQTHRVPLTVADGTVESRLYFKRYHPSSDTDRDLSLLLEVRRVVFSGIDPSHEPVEAEPRPRHVGSPPPPATPEEAADVRGLVKFAHPKPGTKEVPIPEGDSPEDVQALLALFDYPVPYAQAAAVERLAAIGEKAVPALIQALGRWNNESFNRARIALVRIGAPAVPALVKALESDQLYVRWGAMEALEELDFPGDRDALRSRLLQGLSREEPLDRESAAAALGRFQDPSTGGALQRLLDDRDWDVVVSAAKSLAQLGYRGAVPALRRTLARASYPETKQDLAVALADLGAPDGIPVLIDLLSQEDPLMRQRAFDALHATTGLFEGYDPRGTSFERIRAVRKLRQAWASATPGSLREPLRIDPKVADRAWMLVRRLGGGTDTMPGGDDARIRRELVGLGQLALPSIVRGLEGFPPGFVLKRALLCEILGEIGNDLAAPVLAWTLSDPNPSVAAWACWALERTRDAGALPALERYEARLRELDAKGAIPADAGPVSRLLAQAARTRLLLGDAHARDEAVSYLLSRDLGTRRIAIEGLATAYGTTRGFDPAAPLEARRQAYVLWQTP